MLSFASRSLLVAALMMSGAVFGQQKTVIFSNGFDSTADLKKWSIVHGAKRDKDEFRTGQSALRLNEGESSIRTTQALTEQGTLEFWIRTSSPATRYTLNVMVAPTLNDDSAWVKVAQIQSHTESTEYRAQRLSIDDPSKKFLRLDFTVTDGHAWIDDLSVEKILLGTALQKNQEMVVSEILQKIREDKDFELQADALRALGRNFTAQIDVQRQYLEYANGIYASVTLVLATSERGKMANPLGYQTFKGIVADVKKVASPIQQARTDSLLKPLGDIATTSLNIMTGGTYAAFSEPFKTIVATTFDRVSYEKAGLDRKTRKFAEQNGLTTFKKTESFLGELEKEVSTIVALDKDLLDIQRELDKFRQDLDKHLRQSLIAGGLGRGQENYNRVISKDEEIRGQALEEVNNFFLRQAESYQTQSSSNTEFMQFMMKATQTMEETQAFKERFNQIASSVITFYDKFNRSVAKSQNPFTDAKDRALWESHAVKVRAYIKDSKAAFEKAYM